MKKTLDKTIILNTEKLMKSIELFKEFTDLPRRFAPYISTRLIGVPFVYTLTFMSKKDKKDALSLMEKFRKHYKLEKFFYDGINVTEDMLSELRIFNIDISTWNK